MGGNALKNCYTRRYNKDEYQVLSNEIIEILSKSPDINKVKIPYSYRNKETFGDLDILISYNEKFDLTNYIKNTFNPKEMFSNGECLSFEYKEFQIDLIKANEHFNTSLEYLNWNDLGNLIGRIAHKFGLKYGHKGLLYIIKNDSGYNPKELTISTKAKDIIEFLGFDFDRYTFGFDTVNDIYDFVVKSKFFNPEIFSFEAMNHANRVRNKKRVTYQGFLDYLEKIELNKDQKYFEYNKKKEVYLPRLNYYFPEANIFEFIDDYKKELAVRDFFRQKFNGEYVSNITGFKDKDLGKFIAYFKTIFWENIKEDNISFEEWIIAKDQDEIKIHLENALKQYTNN